jgi:hypothetical protein
MTKSIRIEFLFLFVFLSFYSANIFGQFDVEYNEINGSLTKTDEFKKELGRYDGYEIPLYEGEAVNLIVYSEKFSPRLIFVTPGGNIYKQASSGTSKIASIISTVNESGNWILYVVGDSAATGDYTFQYSFASKNSLILPVQHDFCTSLQFVVAHAKAYFLLMENPVDAKTAFVKINNAVDAFIDESDGAYTAKMYEGNNLAEAEKIYNQYANDVGNCLDKSWIRKSESWVDIDDYKVKSVLYTEPIKEKERLVLVSLQDLSKSKQKFTGNYVVLIIVNRKN